MRKARTASSGVGPGGFNLLNSSLDIGNLSLRSGDLCNLRNLPSRVLNQSHHYKSGHGTLSKFGLLDWNGQLSYDRQQVPTSATLETEHFLS